MDKTEVKDIVNDEIKKFVNDSLDKEFFVAAIVQPEQNLF